VEDVVEVVEALSDSEREFELEALDDEVRVSDSDSVTDDDEELVTVLVNESVGLTVMLVEDVHDEDSEKLNEIVEVVDNVTE
jgi:hypothetical protein